MAYEIQQRDLDLLRQSDRELYAKVELLNRNMKILDSLEGNLISDSYSIDAESDIRRSYNCELFVKDSSFLIGSDKKIWIDKFIRPYVGIRHKRSGDIVWYLIGTFLFSDTGYNFDASIKKLSLSCNDLMCSLNGENGGYIQSLSIAIDEGEYIRNVIVSLLEHAGITKFRVEDIGREIPYDLKHSAGSSYYDVLKEIVDLYAGYEMFFDIDGTFVIQKIPTTAGEKPILDEYTIGQLVISESVSTSMSNIYNVTQVWGSAIETEYYSSTATLSGSSYIVSNSAIAELENFNRYGVRIPSANPNAPTLNINGLGSKAIYDDVGNRLSSGALKANTDYVFKYRKDKDDFLLLGHYQAYGEYRLNEGVGGNPFSVANLGYEIVQVKHIENLVSDSLCEQRAKYETWLATKMKDTISLNIMAIPFLDVNWKISYRVLMTGELGDYIIKSISGSNSDATMSVTMIKFSELYPDIIL